VRSSSRLHGHNRKEVVDDSYVITEDIYIEYLVGPSKLDAPPVPLHARMSESSLLFLGYALRGDWDKRATLKSLRVSLRSWAVLREPVGRERGQA